MTTPAPDFHALCAELPRAALDLEAMKLYDKGYSPKPPPEPPEDEELPTDQEIEEWADAATEVPLESMDPDINGWQRCFTKEEFWASIRAALERWGHC
jgi:hypothetical protein